MMNKELLILIYISRVVTFGGELQLLWQLKKKGKIIKKGKSFFKYLVLIDCSISSGAKQFIKILPKTHLKTCVVAFKNGGVNGIL